MFCSVCVASVPPFEHQRVRCLLCCGPVKSPDAAMGLIQHLHRSTQALKQHCSDCQMLVCKVKHTLKVMISVHGVKSRPCCHTKALVIIRHNTIYWKCDSKHGNMGLGVFSLVANCSQKAQDWTELFEMMGKLSRVIRVKGQNIQKSTTFNWGPCLEII